VRWISWDDFLSWAARLGLGVSDSGRTLYLLPLARNDLYRFWEFPDEEDRYREFLEGLLDACDPWAECHVVFDQIDWYDSDGNYCFWWAGERLMELGVPVSKDGGVVCFDIGDRETLLSALAQHMPNRMDVALVFDHARQTITLDHHCVATVHFDDAARLEEFVDALESVDILLPSGPPDITFKPQPWFADDQESR
jgi:hypothetical protein